jgi:hypothetical protein
MATRYTKYDQERCIAALSYQNVVYIMAFVYFVLNAF